MTRRSLGARRFPRICAFSGFPSVADSGCFPPRPCDGLFSSLRRPRSRPPRRRRPKTGRCPRQSALAGGCRWGVPLGGVTVACHCGVSLWGCHWGMSLGGVAGGCHWGVSLWGASVGCHWRVSLWGASVGSHGPSVRPSGSQWFAPCSLLIRLVLRLLWRRKRGAAVLPPLRQALLRALRRPAFGPAWWLPFTLLSCGISH